MKTKIIINKLGRIRLALIVMLIIGFIAYLIWGNYQFQIKTREDVRKVFKNEVSSMASEISQYLTTKKQSIYRLAQSREIEIYYENKALGMSFQYGLKASLINIEKRLLRFLEEASVYGYQDFERLHYVDKTGTLWLPAGDGSDYFPLSDIERNVRKGESYMNNSPDNNSLYIASPFYFRNDLEGYVVGSISSDLLAERIALYKGHNEKDRWYILRDNQIVNIQQRYSVTEINAINALLSSAKGVPAEKLVWRKALAESPKAFYRVPIENTDFEILVSSRRNALINNNGPANLLIIMALVAFGLVSFSVFMYQANMRNARLRARIDEEKERYELIEHKVSERTKELVELTDQLKAEIKDRKSAEHNLKQAQSQLIQSEKMASIGQLASGVAHEINNPAAFVSSNLEVSKDFLNKVQESYIVVRKFLQSYRDGDYLQCNDLIKELDELSEKNNLEYLMSDLPDILDEAFDGVERIKKIVKDLRVFSRKDTGEIESFFVNDVLDEVLNIVRSEMKYSAEVVKDYQETVQIRGNTQKIGQVYMNILVNAAQAMEQKGRVVVKTYQDEDNVYVEISDNGKGIGDQDIKKIFDPFFTTKAPGKGTGLGLSICYQIIKQHGGEIKVQSKRDEGTSFTISMPVEAPAGLLSEEKAYVRA